MTYHPPAAEQTPDTTVTLADPGRLSGLVQRTVLSGGLRVITETTPHDPTTTVNITAATGSRDEPDHLKGAAHFLEHLLFKGTSKRTWQQIGADLDRVGAEHNAYTTHEHTGYWVNSLSDDLPTVIDVLGDMVANSILPTREIDTERPVILEEIAMRQDDTFVHTLDEFERHLFGDGTPLGGSPGGEVKSLSRVTKDELEAYYQNYYAPPNLIVAAAGNLDHHQVVAQVQTIFADRLHTAAGARPALPRTMNAPVRVHSGTHVLPRPGAQTVIGLGMEGLSRSDARLPAAEVLTAMVADAPSSRLFREVREKRGLAYRLRPRASAFSDTGSWLLRAGCTPEKAPEVVKVCRDELADIAANGLTEAEFIRARGYVAGQKGLTRAFSEERAKALAEQELHFTSYSSADTAQERVRAVTEQDVREVAHDLLNRPQTLVVLGPEVPGL